MPKDDKFLSYGGLMQAAESVVAGESSFLPMFNSATSTMNRISSSNLNNSSGVVWVGSVANLPAAVNGVITLEDNQTYFITSTVDLEGDRIVCGENTTIIGGSSENCILKSTGLTGTALITSVYSLPIRNITITADVALDLDAAVSAYALDWFGVNFTDCGTIGTIANYGNVIFSDCAILNSKGLTFDGSIGTIGFSQCIFDASAGGTIITLPATLTITRRFRIIYSAFIVLSGETGINVSASATIPTEAYILDTVNFSGGGTYTTGVAYTNNKALFVNCRGIVNSANEAYVTMFNNASSTTISVQGTYYQVAGTLTLEAISQKFSLAGGGLTCDSAITRDYKLTGVATVTSGNNNQITIIAYKNGSPVTNLIGKGTTSGGGRAENIAAVGIVQLAQNDTITVYITNNTSATDITVTDLTFTLEALN